MRNSVKIHIVKEFFQNGVQYLSSIRQQLFLTLMVFFLTQFESLESIQIFNFPKINLEDYIYLIRPYGWISNFVSIGFGLLLTNVWQTPPIILKYIWTGIAIGPLLWGGLYTFNSVFDADFDRIHPTKMYRPIASKRISKNLGFFIASTHLLLGLGLIMIISPVGFFLAVIMVGFQILYCFPPFRLKEKWINLFFSGPMNHFFRILVGWTLVLPLTDAPYFFLIGIVLILAIGYLGYKIQDKAISDHLGYRGLESYLSRRDIIIFDAFLAISASIAIFLSVLIQQVPWQLLFFIPLSLLMFFYVSLSSFSLWQAAKPGVFIGKMHSLVIIFLMLEWLLIFAEMLPFIFSF